MPPMVMATADTGPMSYYLDHPDGSARWETFIAEDFIAHLRATYNVRRDRESTFITGISTGGYGSLKIALGRPDRFGAVAAIQPLLEPGLRDSDIGARNRLHHMVGGPRELLGENRDAVFQANNPANRALANADAIKKSGLAIYLEVGDEDFLNAHDGSEFLHRILWDPRYRARVPSHSRRRSRWADVRPADARCVRMAWRGQCAIGSLRCGIVDAGRARGERVDRARAKWKSAARRSEQRRIHPHPARAVETGARSSCRKDRSDHIETITGKLPARRISQARISVLWQKRVTTQRREFRSTWRRNNHELGF